jgi:hypothetical protein
MNHIRQMLDTHPQASQIDRAALAECVEACYDCAQSCTACADACLGESRVEDLVRCIRLNLDCFDACVTTGNMLSRQTGGDWSHVWTQLEACAAACRACGEECERHGAHHEHCRVCADACRRCEEACRRLLQMVSA